MQNQRIEDQAGKLLNNLPDRATWNNVICRIYVRQAIEAGIKDRTWGRDRTFLSLQNADRISAQWFAWPQIISNGIGILP